jgi:hypothetical protein
VLRARGDEDRPGAGESREAIGERKTGAQIAVAWLLAQKPWIVHIPGTTKLGRPKKNLKAPDVELTKDDLNEIEKPGAAIKKEGKRYPLHLTANTVRDHRADGTASEDSGPVSLPVTFRLELALHWEDSSDFFGEKLSIHGRNNRAAGR